MPKIRTDLDIDAPREPLFELTQDYELRLEWDPFLREMNFLDGATEADEGVRVWVRAYNGLTMTVRYVNIDPPERVAMTMLDGPTIFENFSGTWLFDQAAPGRTKVTFQYHYVIWPGFLAPVAEPVGDRLLKRDMHRRLQGLKRSVEQESLLDELDDAKGKAES